MGCFVIHVVVDKIMRAVLKETGAPCPHVYSYTQMGCVTAPRIGRDRLVAIEYIVKYTGVPCDSTVTIVPSHQYDTRVIIIIKRVLINSDIRCIVQVYPISRHDKVLA